MLIDTTRFGEVEIDGSRVITFSEGLLGFPNHQRFALIQTSNDPMFFWMQSVEDAALAFVVCDPRTVVGDYTAQIRADDVRSLELDGLEDGSRVRVGRARQHSIDPRGRPTAGRHHLVPRPDHQQRYGRGRDVRWQQRDLRRSHRSPRHVRGSQPEPDW